MSELDNLIKSSLQAGININESDCENSYTKFSDNIKSKKIERYHSIKFYSVSLRKTVVITICSLLCVTAILVGSSKDVKAMALDAINTVKMLFVTERSGDTVKVVQKPSSEVMGQPYAHAITGLDDEKIGELIGYPIRFPHKLQDKYELQDRYLTMGLNEEIPYDKIVNIKRQLEAAIYDQEVFNELSDYSPFRGVMSNYQYNFPDDKYGTSFSIISIPLDINLDPYTYKETVKIGKIPGYWVNTVYPEYPWTLPGEDPMTYKPTIKNDFYCLLWSQNGKSYYLGVSQQKNLDHISKETAIALVKEFIDAQPK